MLRTILVSLLLGIACVLEGQVLPPDARPLPANVRATWDDVAAASLTPLGTAGIELIDASKLSSDRSRADLFDYRNGWEWRGSRRFDLEHRFLPDGPQRQAVLLRPAGRPGLYGWAECAPGVAACPVSWFRSLRVGSIPPGALVVLLIADEPRLVEAAGPTAQLDFVPASAGILCATTAAGDGHCAAVAPEITSLDLPEGDSRSIRIFRFSDDCSGFTLRARAPGRATTRPRELSSRAICGGRWMALENDALDENVVVDVTSAGHATQRVSPSSLPPPPGVTRIDPVSERGLSVLPRISGDDAAPEAGARLLFLGAAPPASRLIPLHIAEIEPDGWAHAPELGSGTYQLKLLSKLSDRLPVTAELSANVPKTVRFSPGIRIRGRVRAVAPSPAPMFVTVQTEMTLESVGEVDLSQAVVSGETAVDGSFELSVTGPGTYTATATSGTTRTRRPFEVRKDTKEIDLGEIVLAAGATVRGRVEGCADGGLRWLKPPDPKRVESPQFLVVPVATERGGEYLVEGLEEGEWFVGAGCGGAVRPVVPPSVTIPAGASVVVDFRVE